MSHGHTLRPNVFSTRLLLCLSAALIPSAFGNPAGERLVSGTAAFARSGNALQVTTSQQNTIIDWQSFSIAVGESAKFLQPSTTAATLNRVTSGNPSEIYGSLESNGKIFLLNPNGILVGLTGRIDTAGFLASTLNVSNAEFLARGDLHFSGTSTSSIENRGTIHAVGGDIYLLGAKISNSGVLSAPDGAVGLGAGSDILLKQAGDERVSVRPGTAGRIDNSGSIQAIQAELKAHGNIYALAINNTGVIRATGAINRNGRVLLTSDGGTISQSGRIVAKNVNGGGGSVKLQGGQVLVSGTIDATGHGAGAAGGNVQISGTNVGLFDAATVDVSGDTGGGTALIGGGLHGADASIANAQHTFVGQQASIRADALTSGSGGQVVVWADNTTRFFGSITGSGAGTGGNGGFAEVSGKEYLEFKGKVNLAASTGGKAGALLLDPENIVILSSSDANTVALSASNTVAFADPDPLRTGTSTLDVTPGTGSFANVAAGTTIELQASRNITVSGTFDVASATGATDVGLTLRAGNNIDINAPVIVSGSGALLAQANDPGSPLSGTTGILSVNSGGSLSTESGPMTLSGLEVHINTGGQLTTVDGPIVVSGSQIHLNTGGQILTTTGDVTLSGTQVAIQNGSQISTGGGVISISGTGITVSGTLIATGGGGVTLDSSGSITQAGAGAIQTDRLFTNSDTGTTLDGNNAVHLFQAANSGTNAIFLNNDSTLASTGTLTIIGIAQQDGDVVVHNNGPVETTGSIQTAGSGNIALTATNGVLKIGSLIASGSTAGNITLNTSGSGDLLLNDQIVTTGTVTLLSAGGIFGSGYVSGSGLAVFNANAANGIALFGANAVGVFQARNTGGGDVIFNSTASAVTVSGITNSGSAITITADGALAITGPVATGSNGSVSLSTGGALTETGSGAIFTSSLSTNTVGGSTLSGGNAVGALSGQNSGGGDFVFNNATSALVVQQGDTIGGGVSISNTGALILTSAFSHAGTVALSGASISGTTGFGDATVSLTALSSLVLSGDPTANPDLVLTSPIASLGPVTTVGQFSLDNGGAPITVSGTIASRGISITTGTGTILVDSDGALNANNGSLVLTSDSISLQGPVTGYGMARFQTSTPTLNVLLGDAATSGSSTLGDYRLDDHSLSRLGSDFAGVVFGGNQSAQSIFVNTTTAFTSPLLLNAPGRHGLVEIDGPLTATGYGSISINADAINLAASGTAISTAHQTISLIGGVWLGTDTVISTAGGSFTQVGTIDGASNLTVDAGSGSITFWGATTSQPNGSIGGHQALASIDLATTGVINLQPDITTAGDQTYGAPGNTHNINRTGNGRFRSLENGAITFNGPLVAADGMQLGISTTGTTGAIGTVLFNNTVTSGAGGLVITADQIVFSGPGSVSVNGGPISLALANPGQTLELGGNSIAGAGSFDLSAITGTHGAFTFGSSTGGPVVLDAPLAFNCPVTVLSGSTVTLSGALSSTGGISLLGRTTVLNGSVTTQNQPITLQAVQLTGNLTVNSGTTNAAVNFLGTVGSVAGTPPNLKVTSGSGAITFNGAVGSPAAILGNVDLESSGTTSILNGLRAGSLVSSTATGLGMTVLSSTIQTTGGVIVANNATIRSSASVLSGSATVFGGSLSDAAGASLTLNSTGDVTQNGTWHLAGLTAISIGTHNIILRDAANTFGTLQLAARNATLAASGAVDLGASALTGTLSLATTGAITDSGRVQVTGTGASSLQATGSNSSITLDFPTNLFAGPVTLMSGSSATLVNTTNTVIADGQVGGLLKLQSTGNITLNNPSTSFGSLGLTGSNATVVSGSDVKLASSTLSGTLGLTANGSISQLAPITISGSQTSVLTSTKPGAGIVLDQASNRFSGPVRLSATSAGANVVFQNAFATVIGGTVGGSLTVQSAVAISQGAPLVVGGSGFFTSTGSILLNNSANAVTGNVSLAGSTVSYTGAAASFGPIQAGSLTLNSVGDVTQTATWHVTGVTAISSGATHNIALQDSANTFGTLQLTASNATLREAGAIDLGTSVLTGSLTLASGGAITDSGRVQVNGPASLSATAGSITLDSVSNLFSGPVTLVSGSSVTLVNTGNTTIASGQVGGLLKLQSTGDITLGSSTTFGSLGLIGRNATVISGTDVRLAASTLSGTLGLTANGSISQLAPITITGTKSSSFASTANGAAIIFNQASNRFTGPLSFSTSGTAGNVTFQNAVASVLGSSTVGGSLTVQSAGAIGQVAPLAVGGAASFTAAGSIALTDSSNAVTGNVSLAGSTVSYTGSAGGFGAIRASALTLNVSGDVTQTGTWRVTGLTTVNADTHNITLYDPSNTFGTLRLTGGNVSLREGAATDLGASTIGGSLVVNSSGAITDSGPVSVSGSSSFTAGSLITLDGTASVYRGPVALSSGGATNVVFVNGTSTILSAVRSGANLTVRSAGDIIDGTGTINVPGTATLTASSGGNITLSNPLNRIGVLAMTAHDGTVTSGTSLKLGATNLAGALTLTASGSLSQIGALTVAGPATLVTTGSNARVVLTLRNSIAGPLSVSTGGGADASVTNTGSIVLVSSTVGGNLSLTASGTATIIDPANSIASFGALSAAALTLSSGQNIVQTAAWKITGAVQIDAGSHDVTLAANNTFGAVQLAGNNITVREVGAVTLSQATASGNLSVSSTGAGAAITGTGAIQVGGSSTFASAGSITLNNAQNGFAGSVGLNAVGNVMLSNSTATTLAASSVSGALTIASQGDLTQTGALIARGLLTLTSTNGGSILLASSSANQIATLGAIAASGAISIADSTGGLTVSQFINGRDITLSTLGGNFQLAGSGLIVGHYISIGAIGGEFLNHASAAGSAIGVLPGGHYEIYSQDHAHVVKGGLTASDSPTAYLSQPAFDPSLSINIFLYKVPTP